MNDESASLHQEVKQGRDEEYLLENPVFQQTFDYLKDAYFKAWEQTSVEDSKSREKVSSFRDMERVGYKTDTKGNCNSQEVIQ